LRRRGRGIYFPGRRTGRPAPPSENALIERTVSQMPPGRPARGYEVHELERVQKVPFPYCAFFLSSHCPGKRAWNRSLFRSGRTCGPGSIRRRRLPHIPDAGCRKGSNPPRRSLRSPWRTASPLRFMYGLSAVLRIPGSCFPVGTEPGAEGFPALVPSIFGGLPDQRRILPPEEPFPTHPRLRRSVCRACLNRSPNLKNSCLKNTIELLLSGRAFNAGFLHKRSTSAGFSDRGRPVFSRQGENECEQKP
jgi:hypothetical protein